MNKRIVIPKLDLSVLRGNFVDEELYQDYYMIDRKKKKKKNSKKAGLKGLRPLRRITAETVSLNEMYLKSLKEEEEKNKNPEPEFKSEKRRKRKMEKLKGVVHRKSRKRKKRRRRFTCPDNAFGNDQLGSFSPSSVVAENNIFPLPVYEGGQKSNNFDPRIKRTFSPTLTKKKHGWTEGLFEDKPTYQRIRNVRSLDGLISDFGFYKKDYKKSP